jgi:hypothetical protein
MGKSEGGTTMEGEGLEMTRLVAVNLMQYSRLAHTVINKITRNLCQVQAGTSDNMSAPTKQE